MSITDNEMRNERTHLDDYGENADSRVERGIDGVGDVFLSPPIAGIVTFALLIVCAWGTKWLEYFTNDPRPYTLFFLVPVAFGAAFFGVGGGVLTAFGAIFIARLYLFPHSESFWQMNSTGDLVELSALAFGTLTVAVITGRLRLVLGQLRQANIDLKSSERRRRNFNREVLLAVTGGVLELCDDNELRDKLPSVPDFSIIVKEPRDVSELRHIIAQEVDKRRYIELRKDDLFTAVAESASNAVKHGGGGKASVWFAPEAISVLVEDAGTGISPAQLARATLERGFSTGVSLGMGYYMMLESVDRMLLSTSSHGTAILLTVGGTSKSSIEQNIMAHYAGH